MKIILIILMMMPILADASCRSSRVKHQFDKQQGYLHGRPGYIVDHVCALAQGGFDSVVNMQYQTKAESVKKDRIENTKYGRAMFCTPDNSSVKRTVFNC